MPMRLNVGVSRKVGLPDYGSAGASCSLELELDASLFERDQDDFRARIRAAYAEADRAVHDELIRLRSGPDVETGRSLPAPRILAIEAGGNPPNGRLNPSRPTRPATANQLKAIAAIARRGRADLGAILARDFGVDRPEELSLGQASALIDELKSMKGG